MNPFEFILAALAVYRLSMLIAVEQGPAKLLAKFRKLPPKKSSAREGLECPHCRYWETHWLWYTPVSIALAGASSFMVRIGRAPD